MNKNYKILIERAANALINWEKAADFTAVARFYSLAYNYTCEAIALQVKDKEEIFRDISRKVVEKRAI